MDIFVDYNNVLEVDRRRGVIYVAEKILTAIGASRLRLRNRASFRLYDGWYELQSLTPNAQVISADIQANTPRTLTLQSGALTQTFIINIEMAYSLRIDPTVHLWHTFRPKTLQSNVSCRSPSSAGCTVVPCPLAPMSGFLSSRTCPESTCSLKPHHFFIRNEQKLVDTMLAADLFSLHLSSATEVAVVSSDDDILPVLRLLIKCGMTVLHVLTRAPSNSLGMYLQGLGHKYIQLQL